MDCHPESSRRCECRAFIIGKVLGRIAAPPVAEGEKEIAIRRQCDAAAELLGPWSRRALEENLLVGESFVLVVHFAFITRIVDASTVPTR
jgi:hypothetical protein